MAIQTMLIGASPTTVYTSVGDSAVTFLSVCNSNSTPLVFSINVVPNGDTVTSANYFVKDLEIQPGDTYVVYSGGEKLILANGDYISVVTTLGNVSNAVVSYMSI